MRIIKLNYIVNPFMLGAEDIGDRTSAPSRAPNDAVAGVSESGMLAMQEASPCII